MRWQKATWHEDRRNAGRRRSRWYYAAALAALAAILGLTSACGLISWSIPVAGPGSSSSANLLVNGSFEQPLGGLLTLGPPAGFWQRFQIWLRVNNEVSQAAINRRQRPGYLPFPPPAPELTGWRILKGTVDLVGRSYWQQAPGQGNQSIDLIGSPGAATIEQTFPTEPGREYLFSGWLAHNPVIEASLVRRTNVYLNGELFIQLAHGDPKSTRKSMHWKRFSYRFRAHSSLTTLKLKDVTAGLAPSGASSMAIQLCGTVLDGLSVTPVPLSSPRHPIRDEALRAQRRAGGVMRRAAWTDAWTGCLTTTHSQQVSSTLGDG